MAFDIPNIVINGLRQRFPNLSVLNTIPIPIEGEEFAEVETYTIDQNYPESVFGKPLFFTCRLNDTLLPNAPLMTLNRARNVVRTKIAGRNGTIKEITGMDDFLINVKGVAVDNTTNSEEFPEDLARQLENLFKLNQTLDIECEFLAIFGISKMLIKSYKIEPQEAMPNAFFYQFTAYSDEDVELVLKEKTEEETEEN